jgi:hypothetical protein
MSRRPLLLLAILGFLSPSLSAQDTLLRGVAFVEALTPAGVLLVQGAESSIELAMLGASLALFTAPNVALMLFEANENADAVRISRLVSSGVGFTSAAISLGLGIAAVAGALDDWGLTPYAGSLLAISVPTLFAGIIDLIQYSVEYEP